MLSTIAQYGYTIKTNGLGLVVVLIHGLTILAFSGIRMGLSSPSSPSEVPTFYYCALLTTSIHPHPIASTSPRLGVQLSDDILLRHTPATADRYPRLSEYNRYSLLGGSEKNTRGLLETVLGYKSIHLHQSVSQPSQVKLSTHPSIHFCYGKKARPVTTALVSCDAD